MLRDPARNAAHRLAARRARERDALLQQRTSAGACLDCGAYCNERRDIGGYCRTCLRRRVRAGEKFVAVWGDIIPRDYPIPPVPAGTYAGQPAPLTYRQRIDRDWEEGIDNC